MKSFLSKNKKPLCKWGSLPSNTYFATNGYDSTTCLVLSLELLSTITNSKLASSPSWTTLSIAFLSVSALLCVGIIMDIFKAFPYGVSKHISSMCHFSILLSNSLLAIVHSISLATPCRGDTVGFH